MLYKDFFLYSLVVSFSILVWINLTGLIYNKLLTVELVEIFEEEKPVSRRRNA